MTYVDGFVVPVPTANREAYRQVAETAAGVFKEYGRPTHEARPEHHALRWAEDDLWRVRGAGECLI